LLEKAEKPDVGRLPPLRDHRWSIPRGSLLTALVGIAQDAKRPQHERARALRLLSGCEGIPPELLAELFLTDGQRDEWAVRGALVGESEEYKERVIALLEGELTRPPRATRQERDSLLRRQGKAVPALIALRRTGNVRPELLAELILRRRLVGASPTG